MIARAYERAGTIIAKIEQLKPELVEVLSELRLENAELHCALFCVENGLSHPDEEIRLLIKAAHKAREKE